MKNSVTIAEEEFRREQQKIRKERHEEIVRTTEESIEDFEHKLGLRNRQPRRRWEEIQKEKELEAVQMGVKLSRGGNRPMSPLNFYDYDVTRTVAIPVTPQRATAASASHTLLRSGMWRSLDITASHGTVGINILDSKSGKRSGFGGRSGGRFSTTIDHGFDPPRGASSSSPLSSARNQHNTSGGVGAGTSRSSQHSGRNKNNGPEDALYALSPRSSYSNNNAGGSTFRSQHHSGGIPAGGDMSLYAGDDEDAAHLHSHRSNNGGNSNEQIGSGSNSGTPRPFISYKDVHVVTKREIVEEQRRERDTARAMQKSAAGEMRRTAGNTWGANSARMSQTAGSSFRPGTEMIYGGRSSPNEKRPKSTPWTAQTMLEPIFLPEMIPQPLQRQIRDQDPRPPFVTTSGATLSWDSAAGLLSLASPLRTTIPRGGGGNLTKSRHSPRKESRSQSQQRPPSSWEETIGRGYYEKRMQEFERYSQKLALKQKDEASNKAKVFVQLRAESLEKSRAMRQDKADAALERQEFYPVSREARRIKEYQKEIKQEQHAELISMQLGMTLDQRVEEARECMADIRAFEEKHSKEQ